MTALLRHYDRPNRRRPAHPVPTEDFSRICTSARDAQDRWCGWNGATLYLGPVGTISSGPEYDKPRYDENLIALLSAVGVRIVRLLHSVALHERDRDR